MKIFNNNAASTIEFSLLIVVAILAIIAMQAYLKRGLQGRIQQNVNQLGSQFSPAHEVIVTTTNDASTQIEKRLLNGTTHVESWQISSRNTNDTIDTPDTEMQLHI